MYRINIFKSTGNNNKNEILRKQPINIFNLADISDITEIEGVDNISCKSGKTDKFGKSDISKYDEPPLKLEEYLFKRFLSADIRQRFRA